MLSPFPQPSDLGERCLFAWIPIGTDWNCWAIIRRKFPAGDKNHGKAVHGYETRRCGGKNHQN
jgi:hypothetical protein